MADTREILVRLLGEETVSRMAGRAEKGLDRFGDSLEATERDAKDLDAQIADVEGSLKTLAVAFSRTSDAADRMDITRAVREQQRELRKLVKARDLLPDNSDADREGIRFGGRLAAATAAGLSRAGGAVTAALGNVFGTLPPQAQVAIGAGLVGAAAAAAPLIGGVISAGVIGAAGGGGLVGGLVVASKHPAVQAAAKDTGDAFSRAMQRGGISFVPATLDALGQVRSRIGDIEDDWERAAGASSQMLRPLTGKVLDGAERAVEGFATAVQRSGPVVETLGDIIADAGDLAADTFESFSEHSFEASRALVAFWGVMEFGVRQLTGIIEGLTITYGLMEKLGAAASGDTQRLAALVAAEQAAKQSGEGMSDGLQDLINGLRDTETAAADATYDVESFEDAVIRLTSGALSEEEALIRLEDAIDRAAEAAKKNGDGIDRNIPKQRANREALMGIAAAAHAAQKKILENGGSHDQAAVAVERGRKKFLETAAAMGVEKKEAIELANRIFGIPKEAKTKADFQPDNKGVAAWKRTLSGIPREVFIKAQFRLIRNDDVAMALRLGRLSKGGPVTGPGPKGVDSQPYLLAPGEYVLPANEVDAAGGPEGVEKLRAALRGESTGAVPAAAGGGRSGGGGGGGTQRVEVVLRLEGNDRGIIGAFLKGIQDMGGNPAVLGIGGNWSS